MTRFISAVLLSVLGIWASAGVDAASSSTSAPYGWSAQDYDFYAGDFNGDGNTDILFVSRNASLPSGILLSDGTAPTILGQTWASNYLGIPWSSNAYTVVVVLRFMSTWTKCLS